MKNLLKWFWKSSNIFALCFDCQSTSISILNLIGNTFLRIKPWTSKTSDFVEFLFTPWSYRNCPTFPITDIYWNQLQKYLKDGNLNKMIIYDCLHILSAMYWQDLFFHVKFLVSQYHEFDISFSYMFLINSHAIYSIFIYLNGYY